MSVQVNTIKNRVSMPIDRLGDQLANWLLQEHSFSVTQKAWQNSRYLIKVNKTGFFRQISGLVFEYKIELHTTDSSVVVSIDDGDIRKQLAAMGVAWFVAWPLIVTAGFGMYSSGEFRKEIFTKIENLLSQKQQKTSTRAVETSPPPFHTPPVSRIDINTASAQELSSLPGLTGLQINQLINTRQARNGFSSIEEMGEVLGLKPHILSQIKPLVIVSSRRRSLASPVGRGRLIDS